MKKLNKVVIIGVGLIGGSIGLAIKRNKLARQVVGISRRKQTINAAIKRGAIDRGFFNLTPVIGADLVILSTPVSSIISIGARISSLVSSDALITDTGSTKKIIVQRLEKILPNFVGAHPLSGSEKVGVINSKDTLFENSFCILTPTIKTPKPALAKLKEFWTKLGARVINLSPSEHDKIISYVRHLPHILAFSIIASVPQNSLAFGSRSLRDTTRIAASAPVLWRDIFLTNPKAVLVALEKFNSCLSEIRTAIRKKDSKRLERILAKARLKRLKLDS